MQSVIDGSPKFWVAPPSNVLAADLWDTVTNEFILVGLGTVGISMGASYLSAHQVDLATCVSWGAVVGGTVVVLPHIGAVVGEVMGDISQAVAEGWYRGQPEPNEPEPEPAPPPEPAEDEAGAAPIGGEYWYHSRSGRLCCYPTPRDKNHRLQISDARMQTIFRLALDGTPFSEREMTERVSGLSGPRFRILKQDWRSRALYTMNPDKTGHFTVTGQIVAEAIANHPPTPL